MRAKILFVCVVSFALGGCGGGIKTPEDAIEKSIVDWENFAAALETGDFDRAKSAAESLKDTQAKLKALNVSPKQMEEVTQKYQDRLKPLMERTMKAMATAMTGGKIKADQLKSLSEMMTKS